MTAQGKRLISAATMSGVSWLLGPVIGVFYYEDSGVGGSPRHFLERWEVNLRAKWIQSGINLDACTSTFATDSSCE